MKEEVYWGFIKLKLKSYRIPSKRVFEKVEKPNLFSMNVINDGIVIYDSGFIKNVKQIQKSKEEGKN